MSEELNEQIQNQESWAYQETSDEWSIYELPSRDGFFTSLQTAKSARFLALLLVRAERIEEELKGIARLVNIITWCAVVGVATLAFSSFL
ncbi:hypothetical protein [Aquicoccus sp.]|uniref:hypothetical protein n=1 Tax=Aquicoccus sp. TaxID=2055851 RepID=UPI003569056D